MKKRILTLALAIGATFITSLTVTHLKTQSVYAADTNATRSVTKIAVDDHSPVTIVGFNYGGYNYYRIADIAKVLDVDLEVRKVDGQQAVKIYSDRAFNFGNTEALPDSLTSIPNPLVRPYLIYYDLAYIEGDAFQYENRNYIKLRSITDVANQNADFLAEFVPKTAKSGHIQMEPFPTSLNLTLAYDESSQTIKIKTNKTDYQTMYENLFLEAQGKTFEQAYLEKFSQALYEEQFGKTVSSDTSKPKPEVKEVKKVVPVKPEVGSFPAKILIDPNQPAYIDGKPNLANYSQPYINSSEASIIGQCTWYAEGRFGEIFGITYPYGTPIYNLQEAAKDPLLSVSTNTNDVLANSIAVFGTKHVVFVEFVERNNDGQPTFVYYTEGNATATDIYNPKVDGVVRKATFNDFVHLSSAPYKGCITANQS